jgi:aminoglycoside phosphotransferase (APT) family kinase protein
MAIWDAEIGVDARLVRRLLAPFAELAVDSVEPLSEGWDRSVWLVDERWAFGFPRRAVAVPGIEREIEFLPRLAPLVPLPIPEPVFVGSPSDEFPWPFFGARYIPGREADDAPREQRRARALELAQFLRALHAPETFAALGAETLPLDANGRADMAVRLPRARAALAALAPEHVPPAADRILAEAEALPAPRHESVVHGDLHARQILVDGPRVTGVIDWVDLGRADPAIDLQLVWSEVDPADRAEVLAVYGPLDDEQLLRARVTALWLPAIVAASAADLGHGDLERGALAALERAATD